jgi:hypothetical protein
LHNFLIMQNRTKFKTLWGGGDSGESESVLYFLLNAL